jgi:hypothetical protein
MKLKCVIVVALALICLSGCAKTKEETKTSDVLPEDTESAEIPDGIASKNFDGYEFRFLKPENDLWATSDVIVEEETGDAILDAIYRRNKKIEEIFNICLTETVLKGWDTASALKNSVAAGDYEYDAIYDRTNNLAVLSAQSVLYNLPDMPGIDLNSPWWDNSCIKDLSIAGRLYFVTGDANLHYNDDTWIIMFNKNMIKELELDNPYQIVLDGKWTLDKFYELMSAASADLNGSGTPDFDDRYGFLSHTTTYTSFLFGTDEKLFAKNDGDLPVANLNSPNFASKYIKVSETLSNTRLTAIWQRDKYIYLNGDEWTWQNIFFEGRALFFAEVLGTLHLSGMRNMQENFGLLPVPKYDMSQSEYISTVLDSTLALGVPSNAENPERTGLIMEALSAESYGSIIPEYYDVALQYKLTRDEESVKMLDVIRKIRRYDLGSVYNLGSVAYELTAMMTKNDQNIASYLEKSASRIEKSIDSIVEAYAE